MKTKKQKIIQSKSGITLIALIITIIILLILAGITISQLSENGLFSKTRKSASMAEIASAKEHAQLYVTELITGYYKDGSTGTLLSYIDSQIGAGASLGADYYLKKGTGTTSKITKTDKIASMGVVYADSEITEINIEVYKGISQVAAFASTKIVSGKIENDGKIIWDEVDILDQEAEITKISGLISDTEYKINNETLIFQGIAVVGPNEELKTVKEGFDYLYDNNYKENGAILLREGSYDTADLHTGSSYSINSKYNEMCVSIIADSPGKTFMTSGEMAMAQNNSSYGIKLKFYRMIFTSTIYSDAGTNGFHLNDDYKTNEYYNCVFIPAVGGYSGAYSESKANTYNCVFVGGANSYYTSNPLGGISTNCASVTDKIIPANATKTTYLTNVKIDDEYNITSSGWKNTGTGTNPDGTQANIGVYGGSYAWDNVILNYSNNNLIVNISIYDSITDIKYKKNAESVEDVLENGTNIQIGNSVTIGNVDSGEYTVVVSTKTGKKFVRKTFVMNNISGYIYNCGQEIYDISGKYTGSAGTRTKNLNDLYMEFSDNAGNWHYSCYFGTDNTIDVTDMSKIVVYYSDINLTGDTTSIIALSKSRGTYAPNLPDAYAQKHISQSNYVLVLDVADLTGSYYLDFGIGSHNEANYPIDSGTNNACTGTGNATIKYVAYINK